MAEQEGSGRRMNRTLTQKYDMHALRALQSLEKTFSEKLVEITGIDEDDLGIELDLLRIFNLDSAVRSGAIKEMLLPLTTVDTAPLHDFLLAEIETIDSTQSKN